MPLNKIKGSSIQSKQTETVKLSFQKANYNELKAICGCLDENISFLEEHYSVQIDRKDGCFYLKGTQDNIEKVQNCLHKLFIKAQKSQQVDLPFLKSIVFHDDTSKSAKLLCSPLHQSQQEYLNKIINHTMVFGVGPAGTGKTYLAVAQAVAALEQGFVEKIILTRPAVEAGESLGFLPGDMSQKIDPYLKPLFDALGDFMGPENLQRNLAKQTIEIAPLAFMRGRTLSKAFIILDEAQNTTTMQMKMFLTRLGEKSKVVITGDTTQIDLPGHSPSGLCQAIDLLGHIKEIGFHFFSKADVVRHPLVAKILEAYEQ